MSEQAFQEIAVGSVVEFFESKEVICGVCTAVKGSRLTILTELNREVNLAQSRVNHVSNQTLNLRLGRDELVQKLSAVTAVRRSLAEDVDLEELWSLLEGEEEGFDVEELAGFVFSSAITENHVAAVQRALFYDRIYFQFKEGKCYPKTQEKVDQRRTELEREAEREIQLEKGSQWLHTVWSKKSRPPAFEDQEGIVEALKSFCLFGQESSHAAFVKELFKRANIPPLPQSAFRLLVRLGVWHENENLYLHEQNISTEFPDEVQRLAKELADGNSTKGWEAEGRRDLRHLHTFTIDSALTRDYDDALSLEVKEEGLFEVGVHIADAARFVSMGEALDAEALERASSIYLPDGKIAMLPAALSEGVCSLKAGVDRLTLSFLILVDESGRTRSYEIVPSVVRIREQMTYEEVNGRVAKDPFLETLYRLAAKLREQRLANGAVILPLPEINVHVNSVGMIQLSRYEKETPSQILVSEWMIAANALAADYLVERSIPGIFRAQAECKPETDFTQSEHEIFRIYRQRRLFARAEIDTQARMHCSLAIPHYTTVTSPIRRYTDLVMQRQLKHALTTQGPFYSEEDLRRLITTIGATQSKISFIQRKWNRFWILKYMEQEDFQTLNALVLEQNERFAHLLLPDFLIETNLQLPEGTRLQSGEMVRVKIERLNPRDDQLRVQLQDFNR